jgi:hypothetical protein
MIPKAKIDFAAGDMPVLPRGEHGIEWRDEFNDMHAAEIVEGPDGTDLVPKTVATVVVEDWLEQEFPHQAFPYFEKKRVEPNCPQQRLRGKVYKVDEVSFLSEAGEGMQPVLALYDAELIDDDGNAIRLLADGRTVLVRFDQQLETIDFELIGADA